ncbi:MAG: hypothetical protein ACI4OS_06495, partial [Akkermansia sp.]
SNPHRVGAQWLCRHSFVNAVYCGALMGVLPRRKAWVGGTHPVHNTKSSRYDMKKTFILTMFAVGCTLAAAADGDILAPTDGAVLDAETYANQSIIMNGETINFTVSSELTIANIYANVDASGNAEDGYTKPTSLTMNFEENGKLVTTTSTNTYYGGSFNPSNALTSLTFGATVTAEQLATVDNGYYTRVLIDGAMDYTGGSAGTAIWNLSRVSAQSLTLNDASADGLISVGRVYMSNNTYYTNSACTIELAVGEVGVYLGTNDATAGTNQVTLIARTPEPATATLSLLALVGMAARRRRRA